MKLIATKSMGRLRPGDEFEVNRTQARALKALGKATDAPVPEPVKEAPRRQAKLEPEPEPAEVDAEAEPAPERHVPRFYRRRDMVAEEE